ncbi:MAG: hypothetical protein ABI353_19140, partial [Isosphaeraceae bacterium]
GPARMLGMAAKGHLGPGADGDVTIYAPDADKRRMFALPRYVLKAGEVIVDDGDLRGAPEGRAFHVAPEFDEGVTLDIEAWFSRYSSIQFANYPVREDEVAHPSRVDCQGADSPQRQKDEQE